jgi:16S rRNA (cytidine1402-2'-O)-methyltransferase
MLYLVPTPIGNLEDITLRAITILKEVDLILAEDTRTTGKLLKHFDISTHTRSYHIHNEHKILDSIISDLKAGSKMALVSDAGTPSISDPGFLLIRECISNEIKVSCLPGPTAIIPALVSSGFPTDKFFFEGFLPHKKGRQSRLKFLASLGSTCILYESPHRVVKCLKELKEHFGPERKACVSREISKIYEEHSRGSLEELHLEYESRSAVKGEIVIIVSA